MTAPGAADAILFGLAETFPHPGWVVLDAARDHRFTGELVFDVTPPVSVYLDRGEIYLAERSTESPLGARLIDAGAINAEQLEHGSMRLGEVSHLGRLFERVPSIDRAFVVLMTEMMNDECVAWVAAQEVGAATSTPYLRHPSGIHRWNRPVETADLRPGDPLPAPGPAAAPVDARLPGPPIAFGDPIVSWGEPVAGAPAQPPVTPPPEPTTGPSTSPVHDPTQASGLDRADSILESDWADRLETHGLPDPGSDPLAVPAALPAVPTSQADRFELIWPSGEIDEQFDAGAALDHVHERDHDRAGPTARVVRSADVASEPGTPDGNDTIELWDFETTGPSFGPVDDPGPDPDVIDSDPHLTVITDDAVMSMRRAVESIEVESLASRGADRSADISTTSDAIHELVIPGRVATRTESSVWSVRGFENATNRSVFDEATPPLANTVEPVAPVQPVAVEPVAVEPAAPVASAVPDAPTTEEPARMSALRRLIGGLRRR